MNASVKRKQETMESPFFPPKKKYSFSQDGKGCAIFTKLIESGVVSDHEAVFYIRKKDKSVMKEGAITRNGVLCRCCNALFLLSGFEVHAGSRLHRPSANMFLLDGRSLVQCQQAVDGSEDVQSETSNCTSSHESNVSQTNESNDNICRQCGDGGNLLLCDSCPAAYHAECLFLDAVPEGDWHCPRCCCGTCGGSIYHPSSGSKVSAALCGNESSQCDRSMVSPEFSCESTVDNESSGKKVQVTLSCTQCQVLYHLDCVMGTSEQEFDGHWFCTKHCKRVFKKLRKLVGRVFSLDRGLSWMLVRSCTEDKDGMYKSGSCTGIEKKLLEACKVMQQSFNPVVDYETGVDLLAQTLFNRSSKLRRLDCSGFYAILLMKGEQLISVATVRIHGKMLAEMPFIATQNGFRQQGMCKTLMQALESLLQDIRIYKLVLPSIDELLEAWKGPFGFKMMNTHERKRVSGLGLLSFPGTTLLSKNLFRSEARHCIDLIPNANEIEEKPGLIRIKLKPPPISQSVMSAPTISCHL